MSSLFRLRLLQQLIRQGLASTTRQPDHLDQPDTNQGFTLLECLMAIAIISLTVVMVMPPLFVATATRVQNRRAEQAFQIAQGEIDRIRVLVERSNHFPQYLPEAVTGLTKAETQAAPSAIANLIKTSRASCSGATKYTDQKVAPNSVLQVDLDADCQADFLMQVYRTPGTIPPGETATGNNRPSSFQVGVRVYAALAGANGNLSGLENPVRQASLKLTSGEGSQRRRPLAVVYSNYTWSDQSFSLCNYQRAGNPARSCGNQP
jgi:prepilin-type N-terminal cleavage/methylation domain-containing protein